MLDKSWVLYADQYPKMDDPTVQDIVDTMTEEQKMVMYALIGQALRESDNAVPLLDPDVIFWRNVKGRASYLLKCVKAWLWHRKSRGASLSVREKVYGR